MAIYNKKKFTKGDVISPTKLADKLNESMGISSTDSSVKLYLVGATTQSNNAETHSDTSVYATDGALHADKLEIGYEGTAYGQNSIAHTMSYGINGMSVGSSYSWSANSRNVSTSQSTLDTNIKEGTVLKFPDNVLRRVDNISGTTFTVDKNLTTTDSSATLYKLWGISYGDYSCARGHGSTASGAYSHAEGFQTTSRGFFSHAEGQDTISDGVYSHAEGQNTVAGGASSHAEGKSCVAYDNYSHAEGNSTYASGSNAHAEGYVTMTNNNYAHSEGSTTVAKGTSSHAEGRCNKSVGKYSHTEGGVDDDNYKLVITPTSYEIDNTTKTITFTTSDTLDASIEYTWISVKYGSGTYDNDYYGNVTVGKSSDTSYYVTIDPSAYPDGFVHDTVNRITFYIAANIAYGMSSHAEGSHTITNNFAEHAQGIYNVSNTGTVDASKTLNSIGIGTAENARANAVEVMRDGSVYVKGLGGYTGSSIGSSTKSLKSVIDGKLNTTGGTVSGTVCYTINGLPPSDASIDFTKKYNIVNVIRPLSSSSNTLELTLNDTFMIAIHAGVVFEVICTVINNLSNNINIAFPTSSDSSLKIANMIGVPNIVLGPDKVGEFVFTLYAISQDKMIVTFNGGVES